MHWHVIARALIIEIQIYNEFNLIMTLTRPGPEIKTILKKYWTQGTQRGNFNASDVPHSHGTAVAP